MACLQSYIGYFLSKPGNKHYIIQLFTAETQYLWEKYTLSISKTDVLGESLLTALLDCSSRPLKPPQEERKEAQDGSLAGPAWT